MSRRNRKMDDAEWTQPGLFGDEEPEPSDPNNKTSSESSQPKPTQSVALPEGASLVEVAVEGAVRAIFTYIVDQKLQSQMVPGARVMVPFGRRAVPGYVLGPCSMAQLVKSGFDPSRLKAVVKRIDVFGKAASTQAHEPLLTNELIGLARWMAKRYACSVGTVLGAMLPSGVKSGSTASRIRLVELKVSADQATLEAGKIARKAPKQAALLARLVATAQAVPAPELLARTKASGGALLALEKKGLISLVEKPTESIGEVFGKLDAEESASAHPPELELTQAQSQATSAIIEAIQTDSYQGFLLQGVTGSGKTEVYLRALVAVLKLGRQAIVLVPEIALTPQTAERFERRLGRERVAVLHSHLTGGERAEAWRKIRAGDIDVVVGARSAMFAPFSRLGCIVIDEEHEGAFKQDSSPRYHARTIATERAQKNGAVLILGSATPSLESSHAARVGRLKHMLLPERVAGRAMPSVVTVDMRTENQETKKYNYLSRALRKAIRETLDDKSQAILFLNRRGFATVITCGRCGHTEKCTQCDITLTNHKERDVLTCHYCGQNKPVPSLCTACGAPGIKFWGLGTERVESEVRRIFFDARVARMDGDTMTRRSAYLETLTAFREGKIDILIGTQMIAKGLDFPNVTLVGIVLADTSLHMPDFRSRERTFQLVEQVSGRAGRGEKGGRVVVQTYLPGDPALKYATAHDFSGFLQDELGVRKSFGYPPFTHLARILVRSKELDKARAAGVEAAKAIKNLVTGTAAEIRVLGPSPAPIAMLEGWHRFHILLKADSPELLDALFEGPAWNVLKKLKGAETQVDVEPMAML